MTKWQCSSANELIFEQGDAKACLYTVSDKGAPAEILAELCKEYGLNKYVLKEWTPYRVKLEGFEDAEWAVRFGSELKKPNAYDGLCEYTYKNQIGKSTIVIRIADTTLPSLDVEVLSPKLTLDEARESHKLFYPRFYQSLVTDLVKRSAPLVFSLLAPTEHLVQEIPEPPTLVVLYHFLDQRHDELMVALEGILARPYRLLTAEEEFAPLHQAHEVDADVVLSILTNPQHWVEYQRAGLAVAERLGGYAPQKVWQRLAVETFDTPENRFVRWFVGELLSWVETLLAWKQFPEGSRESFVELKGQLEMALHDPLFDEVGDMVYFPATSQVLLKRSGYRELLELYRQYLNSKRPAFFRDLQEAIDSRDVATLYEYWCFFELAVKLAAILSPRNPQPQFKLEVTEEGGLKPKVAARFKGAPHELVFNRSFGASKVGRQWGKSYSVPLRPDFSLFLQEPDGSSRLIVYDAKFRFDASDVEIVSRSGEEDQLTPEETALRDGDVQRLAKAADIYKMHTYKDALGAQAAVVLYPGTERHVFWERGVIQGPGDDWLINLRGVEAIPLVPEG
jgi:predicted component of viral defense system (DUF524 family)